MAQIIVRRLEQDVKEKLRERAARHGLSMEEEVRDILRNAVRLEGTPAAPLGTRLASRFAGLGLEDEIPQLGGQEVRPADFEP